MKTPKIFQKLATKAGNAEKKRIISFFGEMSITKKVKASKMTAAKSFAPSLVIVLKDEFYDMKQCNLKNVIFHYFCLEFSILAKF